MAAAPVRGEIPNADCSVCHEPFKEPKIMPCGHVVCRHCLVSWIQTQPKAGCPLGRCAVFETEDQVESLEEKVGALPTDSALAELVESRALLDTDHTCCVCEDVAATALCLHCGDMLCATCKKAHEKMRTTKHHKVEDLCSLTPESLAFSLPLPCSGHPNEASLLFCPTHGMYVCFQCSRAEHKPCPDMQDAEEKTEEARAVLAEMAASLVAGESEINKAIQRLEKHMKDTDDQVQAAIAYIQKTCDRFVSFIKDCQTRMSDLARDEGSDIKETAQAAITILRGRTGYVKSHNVVTRRAEGVTRLVPDMISVLQTRLQKLDSIAILPASAKAVSRLEFGTEESALSRVEEGFEELCRVRLVRELAIRQAGAFTFHDKHRGKIVLSDGRQTATCTEVMPFSDNIVVSRETLRTNVLYEMRLEQWPENGLMVVGVLTNSPDNVALTGKSTDLLPVTAVNSVGVKRGGRKGYFHHPLSSVMKELRQGDRVGVSLDSSHGLHLHVNGEDRGVMAQPVTGPCHALLTLRNKGQVVTALPPTPLEG